jgi:hypothetical protein
MKTGTRGMRQGWVVAGLALAGLILGPAAAASETQIRFTVPQPFRVGSHEYDGGVIALHSVSAYTPTTSILEVWVNGDCLGMVTARRSVPEEPAVRTEALFSRDDDGRLAMVGFQVTGRPSGTTYRFPETSSAAALRSAQTDFPSTISPLTARRTASSKGSVSTVSTSSAWRSGRVGVRSSAR